MQIEIADDLAQTLIFDVQTVPPKSDGCRNIAVSDTQIAVDDDHAFAGRVEDLLKDNS